MPEQCPIWKTTCEAITPDGNSLIVTDSPRAGGSYQLHNDAEAELGNLTEDEKARLTTILVRERRLGNDCARINAATVTRARLAGTSPLRERLDSLMLFLMDSSPKVGEPISIGRPDQPRGNLQNYHFALAYSASTEFQELSYLADSLHDQGLIRKKDDDLADGSGRVRFNFGFRCAVTMRGYATMEQRRTEHKADQCFVAMWFNQITDALYDKAIEPAVIAAGYLPLRIDRKMDFLGKIDDQIIAEIRRSRFVIADFTHGNDGARGSVYYEAGFAHALNIPVIFTCRQDQIDDLHFDTNHFLHLSWPANNPEALIDPLKNRMLANIGEGPNVPARSENT